MKLSVKCYPHSFVCAGITTSEYFTSLSDTSQSHFSFLATCHPLEFADMLETLLNKRNDPEKYYETNHYSLGQGFERVHFTRYCGTLSINRGGCSNMFIGEILLLSKLPALLRKDYKKSYPDET